jgi:hypothetical protein
VFSRSRFGDLQEKSGGGIDCLLRSHFDYLHLYIHLLSFTVPEYHTEMFFSSRTPGRSYLAKRKATCNGQQKYLARYERGEIAKLCRWSQSGRSKLAVCRDERPPPLYGRLGMPLRNISILPAMILHFFSLAFISMSSFIIKGQTTDLDAGSNAAWLPSIWLHKTP